MTNKIGENESLSQSQKRPWFYQYVQARELLERQSASDWASDESLIGLTVIMSLLILQKYLTINVMYIFSTLPMLGLRVDGMVWSRDSERMWRVTTTGNESLDSSEGCFPRTGPISSTADTPSFAQRLLCSRELNRSIIMLISAAVHLYRPLPRISKWSRQLRTRVAEILFTKLWPAVQSGPN